MIKVIIEKSFTGSYWVYIQGHKPNPLFKEVISGRYNEYTQALPAAEVVANTVHAMGQQKVSVCINETGRDDMQKHAEKMAWNPLEVVKS